MNDDHEDFLLERSERLGPGARDGAEALDRTDAANGRALHQGNDAHAQEEKA